MKRSKKKNNFLKKYLIGVMSVTLILVASVTTYAWVKREWKPSIGEENLKIETSGALGIRLDDDPGLYNTVGINQFVDIKTFAFKQVSNCTGKSDDFFTLDYSADLENPKLVHLNVKNVDYNNNYTTMGKQNGYVEFNFLLFGNSSLTYKDIYIDSESILRYNHKGENTSGDPTQAMRISLTFKDNIQAPKHYVLSKDGSFHEGISNDVDESGRYICDGEKLKRETDGLINLELNKSFTEDENNKLIRFGYDGENLSKFPNYYGKDNVLFTMVSNSSIAVTIRIWLEGTDGTCSDAIAGSNFDLKLIFNSHDYDDPSKK